MAKFNEADKINIGIKFDQPGIGYKSPPRQPGRLRHRDGQDHRGRLGIKPENIEWVETVSENREAFLQKGTVDLILATYSITDERSKSSVRRAPTTSPARTCSSADDAAIDGRKDLKGKKVCSVTGSTSLKHVEAYGASPRGSTPTPSA